MILMHLHSKEIDRTFSNLMIELTSGVMVFRGHGSDTLQTYDSFVRKSDKEHFHGMCSKFVGCKFVTAGFVTKLRKL